MKQQAIKDVRTSNSFGVYINTGADECILLDKEYYFRCCETTYHEAHGLDRMFD